ncbi:MAG: FkbM family methyltransferase, partial [Clostridia bacterium]|nr:FkbM family methyltransferase [Clostridia bacterium]
MSLPVFERDLWQYLALTDKPIVMYGMGNGADKILTVCDHFGIEVKDFFASDGFVRGHSFHGKQVMHYADMVEKYGVGQFIVLLSFASSLPDVMANFYRIAEETALYAHDVPVCGENLFDLSVYRAHLSELE